MAGLGSNTEELRHPAEIPLLIIGTVSLIGVLVAAGYLLEAWLGPSGIAALAGAVLALYMARGFINAVERANSVEITPEQFPRIHSRIVHYAEQFGLEQVPTAYVLQGGGTLNAFASKHNRTNFIRINADIVEVGEFSSGPRTADPDALDFIIAHEMGHVAAKHTSYWYTFIAGYIYYIPLIGMALSRAREYTADNHGYAAVPDGIDGIVLLSGGKYLYPHVDGKQLAARAKTDYGTFVWIYNAFSSHPIITKRLAALYDRATPGRIF
jgi:Zn-dependent protease with chaperone function